MATPNLEALFDTYVDKVRMLLSPQTWQAVGMDLSKNDFFTMLLLYRGGGARMRQIADYLSVPLNTATGVVERLHRKGLVVRRPGEDDKRVVLVSLSERGRELITAATGRGLAIASTVFNGLSDEQVALLLDVVDRVFAALSEEQEPTTRRPVRRIVIE